MRKNFITFILAMIISSVYAQESKINEQTNDTNKVFFNKKSIKNKAKVSSHFFSNCKNNVKNNKNIKEKGNNKKTFKFIKKYNILTSPKITNYPLMQKPLYYSFRSNLLYDAILIPNIGAELYTGKGWSTGLNWMYAWWSSDKRHRYWRIYGGDFYVRRYFGETSYRKPLTGQHIGMYILMFTYDYEFGGIGYMSDFSYSLGIEYGYSLPIARRLNLDFSLGIGYLGGRYQKYKPIDTHYVWQETKQRKYFGPTKFEISLVWFIGEKNINVDKRR